MNARNGFSMSQHKTSYLISIYKSKIIVELVLSVIVDLVFKRVVYLNLPNLPAYVLNRHITI